MHTPQFVKCSGILQHRFATCEYHVLTVFQVQDPIRKFLGSQVVDMFVGKKTRIPRVLRIAPRTLEIAACEPYKDTRTTDPDSFSLVSGIHLHHFKWFHPLS